VNMNYLSCYESFAVRRRAGGFRIPFLVPLLTAGFIAMLVGRASAQSFTTLYDFSLTGTNGSGPLTGLLLSGNTLYGTTSAGGPAVNWGTVFAVNTDGSGFRNLYNFTGGSDGYRPTGGLILLNDTLYGTRIMAAVRAMARFSPSTSMARALRSYTLSQRSTISPTATEPVRTGDYFFTATPCMGRPIKGAVREMARCSP
jgi:uncharacterized repeat protein (TIGR03803 family)